MNNRVHARAGRDLMPRHCHSVRRHLDAHFVRLVDNRRQRFQIHAAHLRRSVIAPAIRENFDGVRLVSQGLLHGGTPFERRSDFDRIEAAGFSPVARRRAKSNRVGNARRGQRTVSDQLSHRRNQLRRHAVIGHRGHTAIEVSFEVLAPVSIHTARRREANMRVQIEQAGEKRLASSVDRLSVRWDFDMRVRRRNPAGTHQNRAAIRRSARAIDDDRVHNRERFRRLPQKACCRQCKQARGYGHHDAMHRSL